MFRWSYLWLAVTGFGLLYGALIVCTVKVVTGHIDNLNYRLRSDGGLIREGYLVAKHRDVWLRSLENVAVLYPTKHKEMRRSRAHV